MLRSTQPDTIYSNLYEYITSGTARYTTGFLTYHGMP